MTPTRLAAKRAAVLFTHFGWTWTVRGGQKVKPYVPTVADIERTLMMLEDNVEERGAWSETGRLRVDAGDLENGNGTRYYLDLAEANPYTGEAME